MPDDGKQVLGASQGRPIVGADPLESAIWHAGAALNDLNALLMERQVITLEQIDDVETLRNSARLSHRLALATSLSEQEFHS